MLSHTLVSDFSYAQCRKYALIQKLFETKQWFLILCLPNSCCNHIGVIHEILQEEQVQQLTKISSNSIENNSLLQHQDGKRSKSCQLFRLEGDMADGVVLDEIYYYVDSFRVGSG